MPLIPAKTKDESLIKEMDSLLSDGDDVFHLWWLGQSGFLLQWNGHRALIDPYLSDSLTRKYAETGKPHVRISERVLDPFLLKNIEVVSSSHNHTDHLDAETLGPVIENNPAIHFVIPEANRKFVADRLGCDPGFPLGLNDGQIKEVGAFKFRGLPAKHNEIERNEKGDCRYMGYVIEFGNWKIYHSGDTLLYPEMESLLTPMEIDLALLPINGDDPSRGVAGNLNAEEAAGLARAINARMVIPCHYDMFSFNTADVKEFEKAAKKIGQPFVVLKGGERFSCRVSSKIST